MARCSLQSSCTTVVLESDNNDSNRDKDLHDRNDITVIAYSPLPVLFLLITHRRCDLAEAPNTFALSDLEQGGNRERRGPRGKGKKGKVVKSRNWVLAKKDQQRRQGRDVRDDNKFTGRKRKDKF